MNEYLKTWIKENLFDTKNRISPKKLFNHPDKKEEIINLTSFLPDRVSLSQRCWHILNDEFNIVKCCVCNEKLVSYVNLQVGYHSHCSQKCSMRNPEVIEKYNNSMIENHGVPWPMQCDGLIKKSEETCIIKYGVSHFTKTNEFKNNTSERYKNETKEERENRINKNRKTNMKKYGVDWFSKTDSFRVKCKIAWLKNYGEDHPTKCIEVVEKILKTKYEKLEIRFEDIVNDLKENDLTVISNYNPTNVRTPIILQCKEGHVFERCINALMYNKSCPKCNAITSNVENLVKNFLMLNNVEIDINNRKILRPKELDIVIPKNNLAIEFDGIYWHGESRGHPKKSHLNKTLGCEEKGIQLIHIFENEWNHKEDIVKSALLSKLGIFKHKIFARKCVVKEISSNVAKDFLESNHLQGYCNSSIRYGLFYNDELVACMTFGKRRITSKTELELLRFCNKINTQVIGGASKLFKHFVRNNEFEEIVSYADRRWSNGNMYENLGFEFSHKSAPSYWYIENGKLIHRSVFMKHKLPKLLKEFNHELTEWENMQLNGYDRIWDCGCLVYKFKK